MSNLEIYTYTKDDLLESAQTIEYPKGNTDKQCAIANVAAPLYICNNKPAGLITYTNNITKIKDFKFTTSIGTIITPIGSLIVNFNYNLTDDLQFLPVNNSVKAKPTFTSGFYEKFNDIIVTVTALDDDKSTRILSITY